MLRMGLKGKAKEILGLMRAKIFGVGEVYNVGGHNEKQNIEIVKIICKELGKWYGVTLSADNKKQFLIPEGFAHGFLVLSDEAEFCYKVNDFWHPNDEGGMAWNDPEIGIEWPELKGEYKGSASAEGYTLKDGTALNLSDKDQKWLGLKDTFKF